MLLSSAAPLIRFAVLCKSTDFFVFGFVANAPNLNISALSIGLTIIALGASAAKIFVAETSSIWGKLELTVGNAIGSNMTNIGMVLDITALLIPLRFSRTLSKTISRFSSSSQFELVSPRSIRKSPGLIACCCYSA